MTAVRSKTPPDVHFSPEHNSTTADTRLQQGRHLRALRKEKRYTITVLAKLASVSPNTIRAVEIGKATHRATLQRIVEVLNAGPANLVPVFDRPLLHEDIDIATLYHDAPTPLRNFIAQLLRAREYATWQGPDPKLLALAHELMQLTASQLGGIEVLTAFYRQSNSQPASTSTRLKRAFPGKHQRNTK